jgi:hypothetical protein
VHLIFKDDADRLKLIECLQNMHPKKGARMLTKFPDGTDGQHVANMMDWAEGEAIKYFATK